jgi:hypothetical protein
MGADCGRVGSHSSAAGASAVLVQYSCSCFGDLYLTDFFQFFTNFQFASGSLSIVTSSFYLKVSSRSVFAPLREQAQASPRGRVARRCETRSDKLFEFAHVLRPDVRNPDAAAAAAASAASAVSGASAISTRRGSSVLPPPAAATPKSCCLYRCRASSSPSFAPSSSSTVFRTGLGEQRHVGVGLRRHGGALPSDRLREQDLLGAAWLHLRLSQPRLPHVAVDGRQRSGGIAARGGLAALEADRPRETGGCSGGRDRQPEDDGRQGGGQEEHVARARGFPQCA